MARHKNANGEGRIFQRGKVWYISYTANGVTRKESTHSTRQADAVALRKLRITEHTTTGHTSAADKRVKVGELLDDLKAHYERTQRKSLDQLLYCIERVRKVFGHMKATQITSPVIEGYVERLKGRSNDTINKDLAMLRRAFIYASKRHPPKVKFLPTFNLLPRAKARVGFFEEEDFQRLMKVLPPVYADMARFACDTGCRKQEVRGLRWEWVNMEEGLVEIPAAVTKTGEARTIPMSAEVQDMLQRRSGSRMGSWVFCRPDGSEIKSFYAKWRNACAEIGKPGAMWHDFRRTAIRNFVRGGVSETVAMRISGHRNRDVFTRYNITSQGDLKDAVEMLAAYRASKSVGPKLAQTAQFGS